jgi:polyphosphate kinase
VDVRMIQLFYEASQAGVKIDMLIRGICSLIPGVKNVSENIRVISILGRFLEHSRVFYFQNNDQEEILLGSADLMPRNLNHRVEVVFPVDRPEHIRYLRDNLLGMYLKDTLRAREMGADGSYTRLAPKKNEEAVDIQAWLMQNPAGKVIP